MKYLKKLSEIVGKMDSEKVSKLNREAAYYLIRVGTIHDLTFTAKDVNA